MTTRQAANYLGWSVQRGLQPERRRSRPPSQSRGPAAAPRRRARRL